MRPTRYLASIALWAAAVGMPLVAGGCQHSRQGLHAKNTAQTAAAHGFDDRIQTVPNPADVDAPAYGWRYFTDPAAPRAVVISPQGDYYYSRGEGLHWIAAEQVVGKR